MRILSLPLVALLFASPLAAQSGTLDQFSPFASETGGTTSQGASYNFDATSLTWQAETLAGVAGQLEGFELEVTGAAGSSMDVAILLGPAWQAGTPAWSGTYTKTTGNTEIAWIDVTSANIQLNAGDSYVIQIAGNGTGVWGTGSYESPVNNQYGPPLYLNSNIFGPEWRIGFHTYMLSGPTLTSTGACGGTMTFHVAGATPGGTIAFIWARGTGNYVVPNGPCAGAMLGLDATARLGGLVPADANGNASLSFNVPSGVCGAVWGQALDASNCSTTNVLAVQ